MKHIVRVAIAALAFAGAKAPAVRAQTAPPVPAVLSPEVSAERRITFRIRAR